VAYDVCRATDAPAHFVVYERWRDLAALKGHLATPHFAAVGAALADLRAEAPAVGVLIPAVE
jgi:quinol monooxygenase YgiN